MIKKRITDTYGQITALCREGNYLWIGYLSSGIAKLRKVSNSDPTLIYYDIAVSATRINKIINDETQGYVYLSINSPDYVGVQYSKTNPMVDFKYYNKPITITENSVDVLVYSDFVYFLIPGVTVAKLLKYVEYDSTISGSVDIEKDGDIITDARSMALDGSNNIWVITHTNPLKLIKITNTLVISLIKYLGS